MNWCGARCSCTHAQNFLSKRRFLNEIDAVGDKTHLDWTTIISHQFCIFHPIKRYFISIIINLLSLNSVFLCTHFKLNRTASHRHRVVHYQLGWHKGYLSVFTRCRVGKVFFVNFLSFYLQLYFIYWHVVATYPCQRT